MFGMQKQENIFAHSAPPQIRLRTLSFRPMARKLLPPDSHKGCRSGTHKPDSFSELLGEIIAQPESGLRRVARKSSRGAMIINYASGIREVGTSYILSTHRATFAQSYQT